MHANNEIGTLLPIEEVSLICSSYDHVFFHSDTVQTMGHYFFDVKKLKIDFLVCSAHKLHGPKGIGFLYVNKKYRLALLLQVVLKKEIIEEEQKIYMELLD